MGESFLLFGIGAVLSAVGLFRAVGRPQIHLGKLFGSIFIAIAFVLFSFCTYEIFQNRSPRNPQKSTPLNLYIKRPHCVGSNQQCGYLSLLVPAGAIEGLIAAGTCDNIVVGLVWVGRETAFGVF
jgi:hypothetical protein